MEIAFIDDSPEAVARREDVKRKERQAKGDEDLESKLLNQQIKRAKEAAREKERLEAEQRKDNGDLGEKKEGSEEAVVVAEPVKLSLSLGAKAAQKAKEPAKEQTQQAEDAPVSIDTFSAQDSAAATTVASQTDNKPSPSPAAASPAPSAAPTKISLGGLMGKKSNPLMGKKSNALAGKKPVAAPEPEKKMSNAERIMREEMERKRFNEGRGGGGKRQRLG